MKKVLSVFLCIVMCASMFTSTVVTASAQGNATEFLTVTNSGFEDDVITYTISLKPNQTKVTGAIVYAIYDSTALEVITDDTHAAGTVDANGEIVPFVSGYYATGKVHDDANSYSLAFMSDKGYTVGTASAQLFQISFKAVSEDRLKETVEFKCVEFLTDDGNADNDIDRTADHAPQIFASHTFHTLSVPSVTEVNSYYDGLKVVWNTEPGADKYHLYRKADGEANWSLIASDIAETSYIDNTISKGTVYSYSISAENAGGETSYDEVGLAGLNFGNIKTITVTEAGEGKGAYITWSALAGAENYGVYRKLAEADEDSWQLLKKVSATNYTDSTVGSGIAYNYKVRAFKGEYSADMICEVPVFMFITAPDLEVKNTYGGLELSFVPTFGVETFVIEKKIGSGEFSVFQTIAASDIAEEGYIFLDEDVTPDESYTYTIQAFTGDLQSFKKTPAAVKRLSNTTITAISNNSKGVALSWKAVSGATQYEIYRRLSIGTVFSRVGTTIATSFVDTTAKSGGEYVYTVVAKNTTGNGDYAVNEMQIMHLYTPIMQSIASNNEGIKLTWYTVNGAESYNVYRKTANTAWEVVATVEGNTYTNYLTDSNFVKATVYNYTVEAVAGEYRSDKNDTGVEGMHFGVVDNIKISTKAATATLTWDAIPADSYIVYRRTIGSTSWGDPIATGVLNNTYTDTNMASGVTYEYMVNAKKGNSIADMVCSVVSAKILHSPEISVKNSSTGIEVRVTENINGADKYIIEKHNGTKYVQVAEIASTDRLVYVDNDVEPKVEYSYRAYVMTSDGSIKSSYSAVKSVERIGAPDILSIKNTVAGVEFTWEPVENAEGYQIVRKTGEDGDWVAIDFVKRDEYGKLATLYEDLTVDGGETYYYAVAAATLDGGFTGFVEDGYKMTFMETPDLDYLENVSGGISVSWYDVTGAESYIVYRKSGKSGWSKIAIVSDTTYVDKNISYGTTYTYTIRACAEDGTAGWYDTEGFSIKCTELGPTKVTLSNYASGIQVKWTKVTGAKYYYIYRKTSSAKSWTRIKTVSASTLSYKDTAVNKYGGTAFYYTVRAVNGSKASSYSPYKMIRLYNPKVTLSNYASGVQLKWSKVAGAKSYTVYRKYGSGGWTVLGTTTGTSFKDSGVNKHGGKTFSYTVRAVNGGSSSAYTTFSIKRLYVPTLVSAKSAKAGITFTWKPVTGASGYIVYRKTGNGGWVKLATVKSGKTVKYLDKSAKKGKTYTYTVRAYSGSSTSSYKSAGLKCKDKY